MTPVLPSTSIMCNASCIFDLKKLALTKIVLIFAIETKFAVFRFGAGISSAESHTPTSEAFLIAFYTDEIFLHLITYFTRIAWFLVYVAR